ncbi:uncharacterized protein I303_107755 [Kwoniella dejecticola CBS 10117]|uniref:Uncharacterized protein n=1 Tax=Kwoniella dejecticola CBS 10117 TaxID=1296121 RepID=A0A1A5ZVL9_9TREE|nr:uncharacterized protein I303_07760 [Kwoniella dejecticola CBS 10117]OBR81850.1 hypothetical protein I303_07760 [Kwoniella dejecticola CBS 10117]
MSGKIPPQHPNNYQHDHDHEYEYEYEYEHERINEGDDRRMKIRIPRLPPRSAGYDTQQTTQDTRNPRTSQMTGSDVNATPRINQNTLNLSDSDAPLSMIEPGPSTPSISDNEVQSDLFEFIDFGEQADDEHNHSIIIAPDTETQGEMELWHGISEALYAPSGYGSRLSDLL